MEQFAHGGHHVRLLIAFWLSVSAVLALLGGRWIGAQAGTVADEVEGYLQRLAAPRRDRWLGLGGSLLLGASLIATFVVAFALVVPRLPDVEVVTRPGRLAVGPFRPTSTTETIPLIDPVRRVITTHTIRSHTSRPAKTAPPSASPPTHAESPVLTEEPPGRTASADDPSTDATGAPADPMTTTTSPGSTTTPTTTAETTTTTTTTTAPTTTTTTTHPEHR